MELERLRRNDVGTLRSLDLEHRAGRIGHDTSRDDTPGHLAGARTATARHLGRHRRLPEPTSDRTLRLADKVSPLPPPPGARPFPRPLPGRGRSPAPSRGAAVPPGNAFRTSPSWSIAQTVMDCCLGIGPRGVCRESVPRWNIGPAGWGSGIDPGSAAPTRPGSGRADSAWVRPRAAAGSGRLSRRRRTARGMPG